MTNKLLRGVVRLDSADDTNFTMVLENTPSGIQNQIAPITVEEVFIECDTTTAGIVISLPQISTFNGGWSPKIFITITAGENGVVVVPNIIEDPMTTNYINGISSFLGLGGVNSSAYFHITEKQNWGGWSSCAIV